MEFILQPDIVFLNHGSFGACPRVIHEEYQRIQRQLETQPVRFLQRELPDLHHQARESLASYLRAQPNAVVFVPNPTYAVNELARSLRLAPADEILMSDHEYGACMNAWQYMANEAGFSIRQQAITLPVTADESLADQFWEGVTDHTRVIFLSHISSPTALRFPVQEICRRANERKILTIIDGAHAPGQIPLDLGKIGADFYIGTCHKWMCAPKGCSFLYARAESQSMLEPLIVGWGWGTERRQFDSGSDFLDYHEWTGTHDPSAYLSIPAVIAFHDANDWDGVRRSAQRLAHQLVDEIAEEVAGISRVHPNEFMHQMALLELPPDTDPVQLQQALYADHKIEVPVIRWQDRIFLRASLHAYNSFDDIHRLREGLKRQLKSRS